MLGIPCFTADHAAIDALQSLIEKRARDRRSSADVASGVDHAPAT